MATEQQIELTKVIERYFGADAWYLDISCLDLARTIIDAGYTKQVRCQNCGHHSSNGCLGDRVWCRKLSRYMDADGFCSCGWKTEDGK